MSALPYIPLYVADYLADTSHLSTVEHGAYLLLIMNYWQRGNGLPANDLLLSRIAHLTPKEWAKVKPSLVEFFDEEDGTWTHNRVEQELIKVREKSAKASNAGKISSQRKSSKWSTDGKISSQRKASKRSTDVEQTSNKRSTDVEQTFNHTDTDTDTDTDTERKEGSGRALADASVVATIETKPGRGTRIIRDFLPDETCQKVAKDQHFTQRQWDSCLAEFIDYWVGVPGARGTKLDWQATFRNQLRKWQQMKGFANGKSRSDPSGVQDALDELRRENQGSMGDFEHSRDP